MTIIGVTCVKNEEDIIEAFVRHNLFYLQKLIVLNHASTDGTATILARLVAEGLSLVVEDDPSLGKFQGEKMTRLMNHAVHEYGADWVLLLDADELIYCPHERLPLPEAEDSTEFLKVAWRTYQARPSDDQTILNPAERIGHRFAEEPYARDTPDKRKYLLKAVVPRALAGAPGACVCQGNHLVLISNQEPPYRLWSGFEYAHFSLRSVGQYSSKIAISSLQEAYRSSHRGGNSSFYLTHLEELKRDFEGFTRRFHDLIPSYMETASAFSPSLIHDPLHYRGGPLRYTSSASDYSRLVTNLIRYGEILVKEAAPHAAAAPATKNQAEESARMELYGQESAGVLTQTLSASSRLLQTVHFTLDTLELSSSVNLRISSLSTVVEILKVRWLWDSPNMELVLSGIRLHEKEGFLRNAFPIKHQQYLNFIKGNGDAVIGLEVPPAREGHILKSVEIAIQFEPDPTRIGVKLLQSDVIGEMLKSTQAFAQLEKRVSQLNRKLAQRTTFLGACGFQIYRLWTAATGLIKK